MNKIIMNMYSLIISDINNNNFYLIDIRSIEFYTQPEHYGDLTTVEASYNWFGEVIKIDVSIPGDTYLIEKTKNILHVEINKIIKKKAEEMLRG